MRLAVSRHATYRSVKGEGGYNVPTLVDRNEEETTALTETELDEIAGLSKGSRPTSA